MVEPLAPGPSPPPARATLAFAGCLYLVLLLAALIWLWQRERLAAVPATALGDHGLWVAAGAGLCGGLLGALVLAGIARLSSRVRSCEQRIAAVLGPLDELVVLALSLYSAIAEEFFFRLAVQDALGWPIAVAFYVVLNTGPGFWAWAPVALGAGLLFGLMVESGLGILSATAAHAVVNYLSLRRILP